MILSQCSRGNDGIVSVRSSVSKERPNPSHFIDTFTWQVDNQNGFLIISLRDDFADGVNELTGAVILTFELSPYTVYSGYVVAVCYRVCSEFDLPHAAGKPSCGGCSGNEHIFGAR